MLQLLKAIYFIENKGIFPTGEQYSNENGFPLLSILAKPRLGHVSSFYTGSSEYGKFLNILIKAISNKLYLSEMREVELDVIDNYWGELVTKIFKYCDINADAGEAKFYKVQLQKNNVFLESVLELLKKYSKITYDKKSVTIDIKYKESVFKTFYNILHYYIYRSFDFQISREFSKISFKENDADLYCYYYKFYKEMSINTSVLQEIICVHKTTPSVKDDILGYSTGDRALASIYANKNNDIKNYKFCDLASVPTIVKKVWCLNI